MSKNKEIKQLKSIDEIPEFKSDIEESDFWDSHGIENLIETREEEITLELGNELQEKAKDYKRMKLISLRLEPNQIEQAKEIAIAKKMGYLKLMRVWIQEGIERNNLQIYKDIEQIKNDIKDIRTSQSFIIKDFRLRNRQANLDNVRGRLTLFQQERSIGQSTGSRFQH